MKRLISLLLLMSLLCTVEVACAQNGTVIDTAENEFVIGSASETCVTEDGSSEIIDTEDGSSEIIDTEEASGSSEVTEAESTVLTEATDLSEVEVSETETDMEYETMKMTDISAFEIEPALPSFDPALTYTCADGMILYQYETCFDTDLYAAGAYYLSEGYELYCANAVGDTVSVTVTKDDAYRTLFFSGKENRLYIGSSESGAVSFPDMTEKYESKYDVTVTQHYSAKINGMGYIVRLADGSLIVYDGGYAEDAEDLYNTLRDLYMESGKIYIRAWVLTHSHADHFSAFSQFAEVYADRIRLDTVIYAPANNLTEKAIRNGIEISTIPFPHTLHALRVQRFARSIRVCPSIFRVRSLKYS